MLQTIYTFGFVGLNKLIYKIHGIYNTCGIFQSSDYNTVCAIYVFTMELNAFYISLRLLGVFCLTPLSQYFSYILVVNRVSLRSCGASFYKTCSVLLCVLKQPRVDNSSAGPL